MRHLAWMVMIAGITTSSVSAQTTSWRSSTTDTGGLVYGAATLENNSVSFACNAPSLGGRPLFETGDHETTPNAPFELTLELSHLIVTPDDNTVLTGAVIEVDGARYRIPSLQWNEMIGVWETGIAMSDLAIQSLWDARLITLMPRPDVSVPISSDGLPDALVAALTPCVETWVAQGYESQTPLVTLSEETAVVSYPSSVSDGAKEGCDGQEFMLTADAVSQADLDHDGLQDFILSHRGVRCAGGGQSGYCGAANCSIYVYLSSQSFALSEEFLGLSLTPTPLPDGRMGVQLSGTYSMCGETGLCPGPEVWNGSTFEEVGG